MFKFVKVLLFVSMVVCGMSYKKGAVEGGAEKTGSVDVLRGAHFKVYAFQVNFMR